MRMHKTSVGLDIADHSIELIELSQSFFSSRPKVQARSRMTLPVGIVEHGRVVLHKQLLAAIEEVSQKARPRPIELHDVIFGIPERQMYTTILRLPKNQESPLHEQIERAANESIPLERDDLRYVYRVLSETVEEREVLIYGMSKEIIGEWRDFFTGTPFRVRAYDHELLAVVRGLFGRATPAAICVVDIGAERSKVAISTVHGLHSVNSFECAGDAFTDRIAKELNLAHEVAEQQKREKGMEPATFYALFQDMLAPIIAEITTACEHFEKSEKSTVSRIILVGGSARLKGLPEYIQDQTGRTTQRGSPCLPLNAGDEDHDTLHYIEAIGLALKGLDFRYWERHHPSFHPSAIEE